MSITGPDQFCQRCGYQSFSVRTFQPGATTAFGEDPQEHVRNGKCDRRLAEAQKWRRNPGRYAACSNPDHVVACPFDWRESCALDLGRHSEGEYDVECERYTCCDSRTCRCVEGQKRDYVTVTGLVRRMR